MMVLLYWCRAEGRGRGGEAARVVNWRRREGMKGVKSGRERKCE